MATKARFDRLKELMANISNRLVECPTIGCETKVSIRDLLQHMTENNEFRFTEPKFIRKNEKTTVNYVLQEKHFERGNFIHDPTRLNFDGKEFFFVGGQYRGKEIFYCWVLFLGPKSEAKNYYYTLEFHGNDPHARNVYSAQVISVDESEVSIIVTKKYFGIKFEMFKTQFMDENRSYKVSIGIRNLKEEVKDDKVSIGIRKLKEEVKEESGIPVKKKIKALF